MWSKAPLLLLRVRVLGKGRPIRFALVLALHVLSGALLSWEPILRCIPGEWGEKARAVQEAALAALWAVEDQEPQTYVQVDTEQKEEKVLVELKTLGWGRGEEP